MTSISTMMEARAEITRQLDAVPGDLASEEAFKEVFERKWAVEQTILSFKAATLAERDMQVLVLAQRAADLGDGVADDLARLAS
jgi:hypothetical protein